MNHTHGTWYGENGVCLLWRGRSANIGIIARQPYFVNRFLRVFRVFLFFGRKSLPENLFLIYFTIIYSIFRIFVL